MQAEDIRVQNIPKWIIKEMCDMYEIVFMKITFKQMRDVSYNNVKYQSYIAIFFEIMNYKLTT